MKNRGPQTQELSMIAVLSRLFGSRKSSPTKRSPVRRRVTVAVEALEDRQLMASHVMAAYPTVMASQSQVGWIASKTAEIVSRVDEATRQALEAAAAGQQHGDPTGLDRLFGPGFTETMQHCHHGDVVVDHTDPDWMIPGSLKVLKGISLPYKYADTPVGQQWLNQHGSVFDPQSGYAGGGQGWASEGDSPMVTNQEGDLTQPGLGSQTETIFLPNGKLYLTWDRVSGQLTKAEFAPKQFANDHYPSPSAGDFFSTKKKGFTDPETDGGTSHWIVPLYHGNTERPLKFQGGADGPGEREPQEYVSCMTWGNYKDIDAHATADDGVVHRQEGGTLSFEQAMQANRYSDPPQTAAGAGAARTR
jgi:hypothetical protein